MPRATPQDHERFDQLYTENLTAILGYAARRCDQPGDAADVAAEVFLTAWRRLSDLPVGQERLWLFGTARRVLANQRRGARRRDELARTLRARLASSSLLVPDAGSLLAVRQALAVLPERDREILALAVWDGLTPAEIAALEEVPAATVRSRLMRARTRLRAALSDDLPADVTAAGGAQRPPRAGHVSGARP
jgi:RNA polymerase sigma-70 factor (ECF subfamily)